MLSFTRFYHTTLGKKFLMAVTGVILFLYVIGHLLGNLQIFVGPAKLNAYAAFLHSMPRALWVVRVILLAAVLTHIVTGVQLWVASSAARPVKYRMTRYREADLTSRTMIWGGIALGLFVIYHVLHFTTGDVHPSFEGLHNVYHNVVSGFQVWWASALYIVAQVALGMHLFHGVWSFFQTLGLNHPLYNPWRKAFAVVFALGIAGGNIFIPVAVLTGLVR
jgi:succinate dehydrogenase / fumarate reductase cytochrome b subunit